VGKLRSQIEYLRQKMYVAVLEKGILHSDVLKASQKLDEAINEFYAVALVKRLTRLILIRRCTIQPRQQAILNFIHDYPHRYPPTIREIGAGVGFKSRSMVIDHLNVLVKLGLIERRANSPRCILLTESCP